MATPPKTGRPAGTWGGRRPGAGQKKGNRWATTIEREAAKEELRRAILPNIQAMVQAQVSAALGIKYLVTRDEVGKFSVVTQEQAKRLIAQGKEVMEVWEKAPNNQSFKELADRFYGLPEKPAETVKHDGEVVLKWED